MKRTPASLLVLFVACLLVSCLLVSGIWVTPATAKDSSSEAKAPKQSLADALKAAAEAEDFDTWIGHIHLVPLAYPVADKKMRRTLMTRLGHALKSEVKDVARAALSSIARTGDSDGAWTHALKRMMPDRRAEEIQPFQMQIFATVYKLAPDSAIDPLLLLMRKSKSPDVASWAMRALGGYERSKRRAHVLDEVAAVLLANAPGGNRRKWGEGSPRWKALVVFLVPTLNALTGQQLTIEQWGPAWIENKKTPEKLFVRPLPKGTSGNN